MNHTKEGDSASAAMAETSAHAMSSSLDASAPEVAAPAHEPTGTPFSCSASSDPDEVSGLALGSLLCYVKEFGTPYQSTRAGRILDCLLAIFP